MKLRKNPAQPCDKRTENRWERRKTKKNRWERKKNWESRITMRQKNWESVGEKKTKKNPAQPWNWEKSLRAMLLAGTTWQIRCPPCRKTAIDDLSYPRAGPLKHTSGCGMGLPLKSFKPYQRLRHGLPLKSSDVVPDEARVTVVVCCSKMSHGGAAVDGSVRPRFLNREFHGGVGLYWQNWWSDLFAHGLTHVGPIWQIWGVCAAIVYVEQAKYKYIGYIYTYL
jgi:hypothetical protein